MATGKPPFVASDRDEIVAEAERFRGMGPAERMEIFKDILAMVSAAWASLPEEDRLRRLRIGDELDPRPEPWWKNVRKDAWDRRAADAVDSARPGAPAG